MDINGNRTNCRKCGGALKKENRDDPEVKEHDDCNPAPGSESVLERMVKNGEIEDVRGE